ncbi:MAG: DUF6051 family protein [Bacteroidota bacterium]
MEYTKKYNELKSVFNPGTKEIKIPGSDIRIINTAFNSDSVSNPFSNAYDLSIAENSTFSYPVFVPANKENKKVILLLHGLNERNWIKYLVWAYYLSRDTGSYVILFPISFHINRSPVSWSDPRAMFHFLNERKLAHSEINMSSFANIALSNRLTEDPMRFFNSGYQTVRDIEKLMLMIRNGGHHLIPGGSKVNIFAYSIGAFLAQIILMGNPGNLFSDSRLFMFCGGSVFSNMHGTSKLIMDSRAYDKLYRYYMTDFEEDMSGKSPLVDILRSSQIGMAFRSMIDFGRFKTFRENILNKLRERTHSIALSKDTVIPATGIIETMNSRSRNKNCPAEVWDFPYTYSHESPFPVFDTPASLAVDRSFERLFTAAALFLA